MTGSKLIEVALPLESVNRAGRAEKSVPKKGHPATLHLWWSRKPLGVARAVLFASLVDDPSAHPERFPTEEDQATERSRLFEIVAALAQWGRSEDHELLAQARQQVEVDTAGDLPLLIDPFCGGGAIPVEGIRLGLDALAIDLNPVAALVTASAVGVAQRFVGLGPVHPRANRLGVGSSGLEGIAEDVQRYGDAVEAECRRRLARDFADVSSPVSPGSVSTPVSYLWARTATCTNPICRRETPLLSTWWLCKRAKHHWHARPVIDGDQFSFTVHEGGPPEELVDLKAGRGANYRCLFCDEVNDAAAIRDQGATSRLGYRLVAIQVFRDARKPRSGRAYADPDPEVERIALTAPTPEIALRALDRRIPSVSGNVTMFGIRSFADLLTPRQRMTMGTFAEVIAEIAPAIRSDGISAGMNDDPLSLERGGAGAAAYAEAVVTYLGLTLSRMANRVSTMTIHNRANGSVEQSFVQPAYAFYGDFPEANPFSGSTGSWGNALEHVWKAVAALPVTSARAEVRATSMLTALDDARGVVSTDPPYYDMFDYAALSNLFYVWLRACLADVWPCMLGPLLAPASEQIVSNPTRFDGSKAKAHNHFEQLLRDAFVKMREAQDPGFPMTVYYGYQQTERSKNGRSSTAWEALLESMIDAGLRITATWPLRTERPEGVKKGSNSLASSILLVCRPALKDANTATTAEFRRGLRDRLPQALRLLQQGNIAPVDLAQAAIGPGIAIFTSYKRVIEADGTPIGVRAALQMINQVLDETLEGSESDFDADTRWAVTWFEEHGFAEASFGRAEQLSKSRNTSIAGLTQAGIVHASAGRVRLLSRDELPADWYPAGDGRLTVWEAVQHLIRSIDHDGEQRAAGLLASMDDATGELARELAYRLFQTCTTRGWNQEAAALNGLVASWPALQQLKGTTTDSAATAKLFEE